LAGEAEAFGELIRTPGDVLFEPTQPDVARGTAGARSGLVDGEVDRGWRRGDGCHLLDRGGDRRVRNQTELGVMSVSTHRRLVSQGRETRATDGITVPLLGKVKGIKKILTG
jgi:hypothetical protein